MKVTVVTAERERRTGPGAVLLKELPVIGIDEYRCGLIFDAAAKTMNVLRFCERRVEAEAVIGSVKPARSFA